jgi:hypothetical protein
MSLINRAPFSAAGDQLHAFEDWREAAALVRARWQTFIDAERETRAWAFKSYLAALDAEEVAASRLAEIVTPQAA